MALTVQDNTGLVVGANSYADVDYFKAYHAARGNDVSDYGASDIEKGLVRACDYMDSRHDWKGRMLNTQELQWTQFPRQWLWDARKDLVNGIPRALKNAQCEYALRGLADGLWADPTRDDSGQAVKMRREKVGPVEEEVEYNSNASPTMPVYPFADEILYTAGLAKRPRSGGLGGGEIGRA